MTKDHWKPRLLLALLPFLFLSGALLPRQCNGQSGSNGNFFYYYSPTQRTQVQQGFPSGTGQFFNSPFFNQQNQEPAQGTRQVDQAQQQQQQQPQPNMAYNSYQQSSILGFNHPHFQQQAQQQAPAFAPAAPPARLQFPLVTPTPGAQQQQQLSQQTSPAFTTVTNYGPTAQFFGSRHAPIPQPSQSSFFSTQSPRGTVAPGTFSFFQSPFQYLHQRYLEDAEPTPVQPTSAPVQPAEVPTLSTITSTMAPPRRPAPTPAVEVDSPAAVEQVVERRPKFSSRFRYVEQPQVHQYNPYAPVGSPYTSDLPYTEQRFYSSPTTPTGYAFSLGGGGGNIATSTVHFSTGPVNKINQYLNEVTETRKRLLNQRRGQSSTPVQAVLARAPESSDDMPVQDVMSQDAPSSPEPTPSTTTMAPTTSSTTQAPPASSPEQMPIMEVVPAQATVDSTNTTLEPLLKESSFHTETIAELVPSVEVPTARKATSEISIPKRLVVRKKVARKRLRLDGSGEIVDTRVPVTAGMMIRRIASANRLPTEDPKQFEDDVPKGFAITPSTTTTTTASPEQLPQLPEMSANQEQQSQELSGESHQSPSSTTVSPQPIMLPIDEEAHMTSDEISMLQHPIQTMGHLASTTAAPASHNIQPVEMQHSVEMISSTTSASFQSPPVEALMSQERFPVNQPAQDQQPNRQGDAAEYYEDYYEEEVPSSKQQPHSIVSTLNGSSRIMTAVMSPETNDELPVLDGVQKEDFPGVFRKHSSPQDNSVETDQGEIITRITSSHPSESAEQQAMSVPPPQSSPMTISSTTTTTEQSQPEFIRDDPAEEHPPMNSEEPAAPMFQPTTEVAAPMMTTTPSLMMSSTTPQDGAHENSAHEQISGEEQEDELPMPPQEAHNIDSGSSTTEQSGGHMEQIAGTTMSTSTEMNSQQDHGGEMHEDAEMPALINDPSVSSTTEAIISNNANDDSALIPEMEVASASSTESLPSSSTTENEEIASASSITTTAAPPQGTTEDDPMKSMNDAPAHSQEIPEENLEDHHDYEPNLQEQPSDSEEIGKVQRLALEDTLKRLRERQQTSSTSDPQEDNSPENEIQSGKRVYMRRPLQLNNLPTTGPAVNINAVLQNEEGADRSQVVEKIQRFRAKYGRVSSTTTKRPRRVTRPSPSTERRLAVVSRVGDLVGSQEQVDSFSDSSSSTPDAVEPITTTSPSTTRRPYRTTTFMTTTTPSTTTTTMIPLEGSSSSSTTMVPIFEEEVAYPTYSTTSTETYAYAQQTTTQHPTLTRMTESTFQSMDDFSSTTETDFETITEITMQQQQPRNNRIKSTTTTTTEALLMMTTTPPPAITEMVTTPSATTTTTTTTTTESTMTDFSDDTKDMSKNDYDVYYSEDENVEAAKNIQVSSSTEVSTAPSSDDGIATTSSTTTIAPFSSSTDATVYSLMTTTSDPNSAISAATTTLSSTTMVPDISSTMSTTPVGQLIIHEILPTMPPLKEVSFVIGESVEDDQSSAAKADISDELLAADKAIVRVETNVHVSTNVTTDLSSASVEQSSEELTQSHELPLNSTLNASGESGGGGVVGPGQQRRIRVVVRRQKRLRQPSGGAESGSGGEGRRRRRKVLHRRPQ